jgi:hypothetical protein
VSVPEATASSAGAAPAAAAAPEHGLGERVAGMLFSPREEFPSILARPRFWVPLVFWMALGVAFTAFWLQKVDAREFMRGQIVESGRADKMAPGQMERVLDTQAGFFKPISWASALLAPPIIVLIVAAVLLFVFRFFYAGEITFAQALSVTAWSYFTTALVTTPLLLLVMFLKGDWNLSPPDALQASPAMFLDRVTTSKPLYALASSFDLFSFWIMWLLSSAYGVATRRTTASAAVGVVSAWALLYVLGKVVLAAIF